MRLKYYDLKIEQKLGQITDWYREGCTDHDVAYNLGVSVRTVHNWVKQSGYDDNYDHTGLTDHELRLAKDYMKFAEARRIGRTTSIRDLENTAFLLATGRFVHEETSATYVDNVFQVNKYEKKLPPNANTLWRLLLNKAPEKYRDKVELEHSGGVEASVRLLEGLTNEQLVALREMAESNRPVNTQVDLEEDEETPIMEDDIYE